MVDSPSWLPPYAHLATLLARRRSELGLSQVALAAELDVKQQTLSRWEAGTHRPGLAQIPALAAVFRVNASELMTLAGFVEATAASVSVLFPLEALDPITFERLVDHVVARRHPEAEVHIQGRSGHDQKGTDVVVRWPDGRVWSFQCKRVERFGKAEIERAVSAHSFQAARKFLVLSKVASPSAFEAVAAHTGWTLWDKQVLTREIRALSIEAQERLVDQFFRGQRMALLGRDEPGPWMTANDFFAPFRGRSEIFSHEWPLFGRSEQIKAVVDALTEPMTDEADKRITLIIGPGGIGKTRILKEATALFRLKARDTLVRFLSPSQEATATSLANLGDASKLLVVDDAHDREGLKLLFEYSLDARNRARLLIATRPYAEQRISNELGLYRIVNPWRISVGRLDKSSLHALIAEVLKEFGGDTAWVESIAAVASDSPLVAAMAARVVAVEGHVPQLARGQEGLRRIILSRFTTVITGNLGPASDTSLIRRVLEVLALIQPFHIDDRRLTELVQANHPTTSASDVSRALKRLLDGGVIYQRGTTHRLMPELLGDFLIEESCIGADKRLSVFAENIAAAVEHDRLAQVLVNLGRNDWRLRDGNPAQSELLEPIWRKLRAIDSKYDRRIGAVEAVAYYQPTQALRFVQTHIDEGRLFPEFGNILKRVAYTLEDRPEALTLLWDLGRRDGREPSSHPGHPIRILAELIGYDRFKPVAFNEEVSEFGFNLLDDPNAWDGRHTPLDILKPLLAGEGKTTVATGRSISMSPFLINYDVVAKLRGRLVDRIIDLLEAPDPRVAHHAARTLHDAVRFPMGLLNLRIDDDLIAKYSAEFAITFDRLEALVKRGALAPTTLIGVIRSLNYHATYGQADLKEKAHQIFDQIPGGLEFRFQAAVAEGADHMFVGQIPYAKWVNDRTWIEALANELLQSYQDRNELCDVLVARLDATKAVGMSISPAHQLIDRLIAADPEVGAIIIERSLERNDPTLRYYLGPAIGHLLLRRPEMGRPEVRRALASNDPQIREGGALGLTWTDIQPDASTLELIGEAVASLDPRVASLALSLVARLPGLSPKQKLALVLKTQFDATSELLDDAAFVLCSPSDGFLDALNHLDIDGLLARLIPLPRLNGHWVRELLVAFGEHHGIQVARFVLGRADRGLAAIDDDLHYEVLPHWNEQGLKLEKSNGVLAVLDHVWLWLRAHDDIRPCLRMRIGETIAQMFNLRSQPVVEYLRALVDHAAAADLRWIGDILRHCHHRFVFEQRDLVERYLDRCRSVESALVKAVTDQLWAASMSGMWSGAYGEPMPRDVRARDEAQAIVAGLSRSSPAYRFYKILRDDAERNIVRSRREGQAIDDEEA